MCGLRHGCFRHRGGAVKMTKEKRALFSYPFASIFPIRGNMNYETEEINDDVNENIDDEDLRRFLRGGFGAK